MNELFERLVNFKGSRNRVLFEKDYLFVQSVEFKLFISPVGSTVETCEQVAHVFLF